MTRSRNGNEFPQSLLAHSLSRSIENKLVLDAEAARYPQIKEGILSSRSTTTLGQCTRSTFIRQFLNNHRNNVRSKMATNEAAPADTGDSTARPSTATPGSDLDNNGSQNGGQSDASLSDIDDD
ncbi:hypothetical protein BDM02DRAFT_3265129 [Thelephora ganbajun]|uniref:Uncharacterized protein n=1 Tax=Thelephora ganbajun TaxID=370292 RepID=A0ACB6ZX51_THEGA|nr:hypothetical protein BDM02DRAFT_3265129 [Thelephora ganbajun]